MSATQMQSPTNKIAASHSGTIPPPPDGQSIEAQSKRQFVKEFVGGEVNDRTAFWCFPGTPCLFDFTRSAGLGPEGFKGLEDVGQFSAVQVKVVSGSKAEVDLLEAQARGACEMHLMKEEPAIDLGVQWIEEPLRTYEFCPTRNKAEEFDARRAAEQN